MSEQTAKVTVIEYQYADAGNDKAYAEVALPGALTKEQIEAFYEARPGSDILPEQVGLPGLQDEVGYGVTQYDGIWHEITDIRVENAPYRASHEPKRPMTATEFIAQFDGIVWDEQAAIAARDELGRNYGTY